MIVQAPRKRERLAPETRRTQILDRAARMVLEEGLSVVSMERLGRECGISKGLVYNYFPSRDHLLAALLRREQEELRDRGMAAALQAASFPELIRQTTRLYLEHTAERGVLTQALLADPSVALLLAESDRTDRERTFRFFVKQTRKTYDLPLPVAIGAVEMLMAVTDRAGRLMSDGVLELGAAEEMAVQLILGGLDRLSERSTPS
jgi:AcrR family transcriptional regulator